MNTGEKKGLKDTTLKVNSKDTFFLLSTERNIIMGIAIAWVMLFHSTLDMSAYPVLNYIKAHGYIGVDIFLLLSGISLYFSVISLRKKNEHGWLKVFYKRRAFRLLPSTIVCLAPWFLYQGFISQEIKPVRFLLDITSLSYWIDGTNPGWYVALTILLYLLYPIIYWGLNKRKPVTFALFLCAIIVMNIVICSVVPDYFYKIELALGRIPVFLVGCFLAPLVVEKRPIRRSMILGCYGLVFVCLFVLGQYRTPLIPYSVWRYVLGVIAFCLVIIIMTITQYNHNLLIVKVMSFLGRYTLEIYLCHTQVLRVLHSQLDMRGVSFLIINILAIVISICIAIVLNLIFKKLPINS